MSYAQWVEEQEYDTESEYLNVLRQEAYDPAQYEGYCEEHDESFDVRFEGCTRCSTPEREPSYEDLFLFEGWEEEIPF